MSCRKSTTAAFECVGGKLPGGNLQGAFSFNPCLLQEVRQNNIN